MTATRQRNWVSTTVSNEVVELIDKVATNGRSEFLRTGIRLALQSELDNGISDPELELRVLRYLHGSNRST